jgi:hypothetical protein
MMDLFVKFDFLGFHLQVGFMCCRKELYYFLVSDRPKTHKKRLFIDSRRNFQASPPVTLLLTDEQALL